MQNATYAVTSEPAIEPLTLADLKKRLRITACEFDEELADLLKAARKQVEHDAHVKLITQTMALYLDRFPDGDTIEIRQLPVQSITSVTYINDEDQTASTFASSLYNTDLSGKPARIILKEAEDWESTEPQWPRAVTVAFVAGYGPTRESVPVEAKLAIVEWCKRQWGECDDNGTKYQNLINQLAWSGAWKAM